MKIISFLLFLLMLSKLDFAQVPANPPHFIFYLADDQDLLDYGCYGNAKVHTPAVDGLAGEGMRFTRCYTSQAICAPSRSQLYTGSYPFRNGCMANHIPSKPTVKSVAHYMKELGYEVILAGKSHVGPDLAYDWTHYWPAVNNREIPMEAIDRYLADAQKPFCLFVASDYPHAPYPTDTKYSADRIKQLPYENRIPGFKGGYYQNIEYDNNQLKRVLELVDKHGIRNNTVFVYASDHGISGKFTVKEKGLRVPLIVRWPEMIRPNSVNSNYVGFVDVLPTFIEIAGGEVPDDMDGKSFVNLINGEDCENHDFIYGISTNQNIQKCSVFPSRMITSTTDNFKLIKNFNSIEVYRQNLGADSIVNAFIKMGAESFSDVPFEELYDLKKDPYEKRNLAMVKKFQSIKERLSRELTAWMESQGDFLAEEGVMPLIKPTRHPLDRNSKWNQIPNKLLNTLAPDVYAEMHY